MHSEEGEYAGFLLNSVIYTVLMPGYFAVYNIVKLQLMLTILPTLLMSYYQQQRPYASVNCHFDHSITVCYTQRWTWVGLGQVEVFGNCRGLG